ncbi:hypothetical protein AAY473_035779 [Plecturocebus cupreus]
MLQLDNVLQDPEHTRVLEVVQVPVGTPLHDVFEVPSNTRVHKVIEAPDNLLLEDVFEVPVETGLEAVTQVPKNLHLEEVVEVLEDRSVDMLEFLPNNLLELVAVLPENTRLEKVPGVAAMLQLDNVLQDPQHTRVLEVVHVSVGTPLHDVFEVPSNTRVHKVIEAPDNLLLEDVFEVPVETGLEAVTQVPKNLHLEEVVEVLEDRSVDMLEFLPNNLLELVAVLPENTRLEKVPGVAAMLQLDNVLQDPEHTRGIGSVSKWQHQCHKASFPPSPSDIRGVKTSRGNKHLSPCHCVCLQITVDTLQSSAPKHSQLLAVPTKMTSWEWRSLEAHGEDFALKKAREKRHPEAAEQRPSQERVLWEKTEVSCNRQSEKDSSIHLFFISDKTAQREKPLWEAKVGESRGQAIETILANMVKLRLY